MRRFLKVVLLQFFLLFTCILPAEGQPKGILERAFFYRDIENISVDAIESPLFNEIHLITQPFKSQCSNMNRIIIPFFFKDISTDKKLFFNLFRTDNGKKLVFSTSIDVGEFPAAKKRSYPLKSVFHYIWFPPQSDSKNKNYFWEIGSDGKIPIRVGIYLTNRAHHGLKPVLIDNNIQEKTFATFISFCQYRFDWGEILATTGERLWRDKYFIGFYLILITGIAVLIKINGTNKANRVL